MDLAKITSLVWKMILFLCNASKAQDSSIIPYLLGPHILTVTWQVRFNTQETML